MAEAFVIMQIGNPELDRVFTEVIVPAIEASGLEARRVDKHNQGRLLKSEIVEFIQRAEIIVADLTNERPNCYLEIGYAMGLDKFQNLILTAREDHLQGSPNHAKGGPKVHFDLSGYDILFWEPRHPEKFRAELERRIGRRRMVLSPPPSAAPPLLWDEGWIESQRTIAQQGLAETEKQGSMEIRFTLDQPKPRKTPAELNEAASNSTIRTGWPIAVFLGNRQEYRPQPTEEGIVAVIPQNNPRTYDFWAIRRNCDFYLLQTIFEDERALRRLFWDVRIARATETLLYCARLYTRLKIDPLHRLHVAVKYGGLQGRFLTHSSDLRPLDQAGPCRADKGEAEVQSTLEGIEANLPNLVKNLVAPLLELFDFYQLDDSTYEAEVDRFVKRYGV